MYKVWAERAESIFYAPQNWSKTAIQGYFQKKVALEERIILCRSEIRIELMQKQVA